MSVPPGGSLERIPESAAAGYYDVPMLKPPVWRWEIAGYFFLGGLSAGAFILARVADRFGGPAGRETARAGTTIAAAAFAPCPLLLIKDLGDPGRFHHMLRIFKPASPMNLGAWVLTAYGGILGVAALREWSGLADAPKNALTRVADSGAQAMTDLAGLPLAVMLAGYTGVLLSTTSIPVWARNPWLGPLFSASALHSGAAAIDLALQFRDPAGARPLGLGVRSPETPQNCRQDPAELRGGALGPRPRDSHSAKRSAALNTERVTATRSAQSPAPSASHAVPSQSARVPRAIEAAETAGRLAEAASLAGYLISAGRLAEPLISGEYAPQIWVGAVGLGMALPAAAGLAGRGARRPPSWLRIAGSALALAGAFALRWAVVHAGHTSARDPKAAHTASQ